MSPASLTSAGERLDLAASRRRLLLDTLGIAVSAAAFGLVFGLAAHNAGYSLVEAMASSIVVFAGASQFAAAGYVAAGLTWAPILVLTFFLNARHVLYSASLAPRLRGIPMARRAAMAHVLTDESFALSAAHFQRLGQVDQPGYWMAAVIGVFVPWNVATVAGVLLGEAIPDPSRFGLDIVFPAAMAGLAVGVATGRRGVVAAGAGAIVGIGLSLVVGPALGIVAGGLLGPLAGMALPERPGATPARPDSDLTGTPVALDEALSDMSGGGEGAVP